MEEAEPFPDDWTPNMRANLVFLTRRGYVLLIHKKTGLGAGKINGPGGKLEPGETAIEAARREVREELLIEVGELEEMGELHFDFVDGLKLHCVVFHGTEFTGTPTETREAKPEWFYFSEVPYGRMWADDRYWLPRMLEGEKFKAWFRFDGEAMLSRKVVFENETSNEIAPDELKKLRSFRTLMSFLMCIPAAVLIFFIAIGSMYDRLSPTYSGRNGLFEDIYVLSTILSVVAALWGSSRKLLVVATALLAPFLFGSVIIAFLIPEFFLTIFLPILWLTFCLVAWPSYKKIEASKRRLRS